MVHEMKGSPDEGPNPVWLERVKKDGQMVYDHMRAEYERGRRSPFSIAQLCSDLNTEGASLSRERVYGALVRLAMRQLVWVEGDSIANTVFTPLIRVDVIHTGGGPS